MSYELIFTEERDGVSKDIGENVFIEDLSSDYKVYLFYYPGSMPDEDLEERLRSLALMTGKNLFVNIGRLDDPKYYIITEKFKIKSLPVVVLTGIEGIASLLDGSNYTTTYVRLDRKDLLGSQETVIECIQRVFSLFIRGEVLQAMTQARSDNREAAISQIKRQLFVGLNKVGKFLSENDVNISLMEGKFQILSKHPG